MSDRLPGGQVQGMRERGDDFRYPKTFRRGARGTHGGAPGRERGGTGESGGLHGLHIGTNLRFFGWEIIVARLIQ